MKQILIDKFTIPQNAVEEFTERMNYNRGFIKDIQGFIKDSVYQRKDENGNSVIVTVAEWENESFLAQAKEAVLDEYKRIGFNPQEMYSRLNITIERGIYSEVID